MISCRNIYKSFGKNKVITDLSLDFKQGSTLLIGPNGSGKSTLLLLISGLYKPDSGRVIFIDKKVKEHSLSISTDSINIPGVFTFYEIFNFQFSCNASNNSLFEVLVNDLGLIDFLHTKVSDASTGVKKKFSVISALVKMSEILLLDEPFNGIDYRSKELLNEIIFNDKRDKIVVDHSETLTCDNEIHLW